MLVALHKTFCFSGDGEMLLRKSLLGVRLGVSNLFAFLFFFILFLGTFLTGNLFALLIAEGLKRKVRKCIEYF